MTIMRKLGRSAGIFALCALASSPLLAKTESEKANEFFAKALQEALADKPVFLTYLGQKKDYGKWTDISEVQDAKDLALTKRQLQELKKLDYDKLGAQEQLSYRLFEDQSNAEIAGYKFRNHTYFVNQMFGTQSQTPAFLINMHRVSSKSDAEAYVSRLNGVKALFAQLEQRLLASEKLGVLTPKFVFPKVIGDSQNIIVGKPFDNSDKSSPLWEDINKKVDALDISKAEKSKLLADAKTAMLTSFKPAYQSLIALLKQQEQRASTQDGAWKFPDGENYYKYRLKKITTTDMSADEIHQLGLAEVARIHNEMKVIKDKVGFKGNLQEFFTFMRSDKQFKLPNTDAGRAVYLKNAVTAIDTMKASLDSMFIVKPKAELKVKRVEPFREKSAGRAFYQSPSLDGSRPGTYYVNLEDMNQMAVYELEALAYHEGIPGHHMQRAIAQELEGIPTFRKIGGYTAYTEGWGLYSEMLPKEYGFYQDPYSDFGRLSMELWRACRLVVDTGIHAQKWSREKAIDYLREATPSPELDVVKAIERYIVMPGQATAYKIGMLKILELRANAKTALGKKFDIRDFHDVILKNGALPLSVLEEQVDAYIKLTK